MDFAYVFKKINSSNLLKNIIFLATGSATAAIIATIFSPIITRIYNPSALGQHGVFLSLVAIASPIIGLRLHLATVVTKSLDEVYRISNSATVVSAAVTVIFTSLLAIIIIITKAIYNHSIGSTTLYFLPLTLILVGWLEISTSVATREGEFSTLAKLDAATSLAVNLTRCIGGFFAPTATMLIAIAAIAPAFRYALLLALRPHLRLVNKLASISEVKSIIWKYRDYAIFRAPADLLSSLTTALPVLLLALSFGASSAGFFVISRTMLSLPNVVLATSTSGALFARLSEHMRANRPIKPLFFSSTVSLLAVAPLVIIGALAAPLLFTYIFGPNWEAAGRYAQIMAAWFSSSLAAQPALQLVAVINRQRLLLLINIFNPVACLAATGAAAILSAGDLFVIAAISSINVVCNLALIIWMHFEAVKFDSHNTSSKS